MAKADLLSPGRLDKREGQFEPATLSRPALDADCTAVELYQMLANRQTKARAFASSSRGVLNLVELIEDGGLFFLGYANPGVADGDVQRITFDGRFNPYAPIFRSEFHSVIQKVV